MILIRGIVDNVPRIHLSYREEFTVSLLRGCWVVVAFEFEHVACHRGADGVDQGAFGGVGGGRDEDCEVGSLRAGGAGFCEVDGAGGHSVLDGDGWMVMVEDGG